MIHINQIVRHIFAYKTTFWVCQVTIIGDWKLPPLWEKLHRNECIPQRYESIPERNEFVPNRNEKILDK